MKNVKCLLLFSGGLDSMIALKLLQGAGIIVQPICFKSYFFDCSMANKACRNYGIKLREVDISDIHLAMVKRPRFGYGTSINPCIDCHLMMLQEAKKIMEDEGYDFLATGEVLGQRPMSQNAHSLSVIERAAGLDGQVVRPLSLKLLPETEAEKKNLINREAFCDISGRGRKEQSRLAQVFGIIEYPSPSGGCILTDKNYGKIMRSLLKLIPNADGSDCTIIRKGRAFFFPDYFIVVGRNKEESEYLENNKKGDDIILIPEDFPGPTVMVRVIEKNDTLNYVELGIDKLLEYSKSVPEEFIIEVK